MKHHKKTYEDVFSSDRKGNRSKLNLDEVSVDGMELNEYIDLFKDFLKDFYSGFFLYSVKLSWMRRKFKYYGKKTILPMYKNSLLLNSAFVKLVRRNVGNDLQVITKNIFFQKLESYFDDFFPDFEENNPFENPDYYKFPYKNITSEFLIVVHQLDDRLGLLKEADEKDMSFAVFLDYVINHVYCENEKLEKDRYEIKQNNSRLFPYYITDNNKKLKAKKGQKRI